MYVCTVLLYVVLACPWLYRMDDAAVCDCLYSVLFAGRAGAHMGCSCGSHLTVVQEIHMQRMKLALSLRSSISHMYVCNWLSQQHGSTFAMHVMFFHISLNLPSGHYMYIVTSEIVGNWAENRKERLTPHYLVRIFIVRCNCVCKVVNLWEKRYVHTIRANYWESHCKISRLRRVMVEHSRILELLIALTLYLSLYPVARSLPIAQGNAWCNWYEIKYQRMVQLIKLIVTQASNNYPYSSLKYGCNVYLPQLILKVRNQGVNASWNTGSETLEIYTRDCRTQLLVSLLVQVRHLSVAFLPY